MTSEELEGMDHFRPSEMWFAGAVTVEIMIGSTIDSALRKCLTQILTGALKL